MPKGRTFVYYYNGDQNKPDSEDDLLEETPIPKTGDVIERKGKSWMVSTVMTVQSANVPETIPIHRVFLVD
jgi:hypothetical protein